MGDPRADARRDPQEAPSTWAPHARILILGATALHVHDRTMIYLKPHRRTDAHYALFEIGDSLIAIRS
eukprot:3340565-Pyramimonas_sp.AAC.2